MKILIFNIMTQEKDFQIQLKRWFSNHAISSSAWEQKICKTNAMPFSKVQEHQLRALWLSKHKQLYYKIPDVGYDKKPFDNFILSNSNAYVCIFYYQKRGDKDFVVIDVDDFIKESEGSKKRSLTKERAIEIGKVFTLGVKVEKTNL